MKSNKYLGAIALVFSIWLGSCSILDIDIPDNLVKDDYWKTRDQLNAALMGVYTGIHNNMGTLLRWGDLRSELYASGTKSSDADKELVKQDITTTNGLANWSGVYKSINWANSFIANADLVLKHDPSVTPEEVESMVAEALTIRSLFYFYLVRTFKDVPVSLEPYESDMQANYSAPLKEEDVLNQIEIDLKRAYAGALEAHNGGPTQFFGRINKNAVRALWADVKLWRKDYTGCIKLCEELDAVYSTKMIQSTQWFTMFSVGNSDESIFEYQYIDNGISSPFFNIFRDGSSNVFMCNNKAYNEFVSVLFPSDGDGRYADTVRTMLATVRPVTDKLGEVYKYVGATPYLPEYKSVNDRRSINFIMYRYREVVLMKAEALGMLERYTEAIDAINTIREATQVPLTTESEYGRGATFFSNLLNERIVELAYEGKQWFSMVRMARNTGYHDLLLIDRIALTTLLDIKIQTMRARLLDPDSWFLPYFNNEVERNPLLEQKSYYEGK